MNRAIEKYGRRIEEFILILIILLNVLDFFGVLPGDVDYFKKGVGWFVLVYLLYKSDLTNILFGQSHKKIDFLLILSYFALVIKEFVGYAMSSLHQASFLTTFYTTLITNADVIEKTGFYIGAIGIILISFYYATKFPILKPSVMHVIHEEGQPPKHIGKLIIRFLTIFFVLISFFIVVFNLMMEWLGIAVEAPLIMILLIFYLFHATRFKAESLIYKVGKSGENFFAKFIEMFKYKHTLLLGIAGMLVLHIITEIGNFIIPYITGNEHTLYFSQIGAGHTPLLPLFIQNIIGLEAMGQLGLGILYVLNVIGILMIMILPAYFWYDAYIGKRIGFSKRVLSLFLMSSTALLLKPLFMISSIKEKNLAGADITTQLILTDGIWQTIGICVLVGVLTYLLSFKFKKEVELVSIKIALAGFGVYIFYFFKDITGYYIDAVIFMIQTNHYFIGTIIFLFLTVTGLFYIGGLLIFLFETTKSYFRIKSKIMKIDE